MGVPLLVALLGDDAAGPVIGAILVDLIVTSTLCLALAQSSSHRSRAADERSMLTAAALSLRGALTNPLPWAIALGAVFAATRPRAARRRSRRSFACSATRPRRSRCSRSAACSGAPASTPTRRRRSAHYLPVALIKLLVHPALVFAIGLAARALGAPCRRSG